MKKIFNLILAALVIIGAAACTKNNEANDVVLPAEGLSFYADLSMTRVDLQESNGVWNTAWEGNEILTVVAADRSASYEFVNTPAEPNKFTCTTAGVESLVGNPVVINHTPESLSLIGKQGIYVQQEVGAFNPTTAIKLTAMNSFLRYDYQGAGTVTFTLVNNAEPEAGAFFVEENANVQSVTTDARGENWISFLATTEAAECTLTYSVNGIECKKTTLSITSGKVYNLGMLSDPEVETKEVFLVPGVWASDNARFAVYESDTQSWVSLAPVSGEFGLYSAEVSTSNIIFVRMNPSSVDNTWDNKWNQTADLVVPTDGNNCYYITDWGTDASTGEWRAYTPIEWSIAGTFTNNWTSELKMEQVAGTVYALKSQTLAAYDEFKVKSYGSWTTSFGAGQFAYSTPGHWQTIVLNSSGNIVVDTAGSYDIYFDIDNTRLYIVTAGSDYTAATEQTVEGQAPKQDEDAAMLYLKPNSNWKVDNARFAAYFFGNGERWVSMTDSDSDGIYEVAVPTDKEFPSIIFCRMNPSATANNWDNKWNQTADLTIPTDGTNLYTIKDGTWDKGGGTWSVK
ncbi:MAG: hypothetical protein IJX65_01910 [Alistipes sp.]|nr:hypothetical protein [Alistipes sp.]